MLVHNNLYSLINFDTFYVLYVAQPCVPQLLPALKTFFKARLSSTFFLPVSHQVVEQFTFKYSRNSFTRKFQTVD